MALNKDTLLNSVMAASGGKLVVKYNANGDPLVMVRIPKFNLEDIDPSLGTGPHPAFIVNGVAKNEIYIGAYQAILEKNCAISIPGQLPKSSINYDAAKAACVANGPGFHLMTAWEWAAIAMWCYKNGFQPRGNTGYGRSHEATWETAVRTDGRNPGATDGTPRTLGGSGPVSWRHDNTLAGIADLVGNVWEWNDGLKMVDGRLYFPVDNNYSLAESSWPASPVYFDATVGPVGSSTDAVNGEPVISDRITHFSETPTPAGGEDLRYLAHTRRDVWQSMGVAATYDSLAVSVRQQLAQLLITPKLTSGGSPLFADIKGGVWGRNYGTVFPIRGGISSVGARAGLAALSMSNRRANTSSTIGFRPAFIL